MQASPSPSSNSVSASSSAAKPAPEQQEIKIIPVQQTVSNNTSASVATTNAVAGQPDVKIVSAVNSTTKSVESDSAMHTVLKGETLYGISRNYSMSLDSLKAWNNLPDYGIKEGDKLYLARPDNIQSESNLVHVVNPGETIYKIAKTYNVTVQQLKDWNNKKDDVLNIGEKLYIRPTP